MNNQTNHSARFQKAIPIFEKMRDDGVLWLNAKDISNDLGYCKYWVSKKICEGHIKSKIDKTRGGKTKIYRIVHVDWIIEFLKSYIGKGGRKSF